jgi:nickel-dependent lactate racemase
MKTIIVVPDFTRKAHLKEILPSILKRHKEAEIIIATGLHRPPTKKEIKDNLGSIVNRAKISAHNYKDVFFLGKSKNGIPIYINKKLKSADSIITIGVVEPHLYAGYSGGTKVVSIGLAGEETINATHHPRFLDHPATKICSIKDNPFRDFINEVSSLLPIKYSLNIINDKNGNLMKIFRGKPTISFNKAVSYCQRISEKKAEMLYDAVICDTPKEKAVNIYQASRAFNYVANTRKPAIKNKSLILVRVDLKEGFGKGLAEKRFMKIMFRMKHPEKFLSDIKKKGCLAGEHRAYMVAKAMLKAKLGFITKSASLYKNKSLPFLFLKDIEEANRFIKIYFKKKPKIYHLKNAFNTVLVKNHN